MFGIGESLYCMSETNIAVYISHTGNLNKDLHPLIDSYVFILSSIFRFQGISSFPLLVLFAESFHISSAIYPKPQGQAGSVWLVWALLSLPKHAHSFSRAHACCSHDPNRRPTEPLAFLLAHHTACQLTFVCFPIPN